METITITVDDDITFHSITRLRHHEDELGLVIKGHLFVEFVINQIILKRCKSPKEILNDSRAYPFSVKLQIVYSMGLMPNPIHQNIRKINRIRNELAHNLNIDYKKVDFTFHRADGQEVSIKQVAQKKRYPERYYIKILCFGTLSQLRNFYVKEFGEFPKYQTTDAESASDTGQVKKATQLPNESIQPTRYTRGNWGTLVQMQIIIDNGVGEV